MLKVLWVFFGNFTDLKVLVHGFNFLRKLREVRQEIYVKSIGLCLEHSFTTNQLGDLRMLFFIFNMFLIWSFHIF